MVNISKAKEYGKFSLLKNTLSYTNPFLKFKEDLIGIVLTT